MAPASEKKVKVTVLPGHKVHRTEEDATGGSTLRTYTEGEELELAPHQVEAFRDKVQPSDGPSERESAVADGLKRRMEKAVEKADAEARRAQMLKNELSEARTRIQELEAELEELRAEASETEVKATDAARKIAEDAGFNISDVTPTGGPDGDLITKDDAEAHAAALESEGEEEPEE